MDEEYNNGLEVTLLKELTPNKYNNKATQKLLATKETVTQKWN